MHSRDLEFVKRYGIVFLTSTQTKVVVTQFEILLFSTRKNFAKNVDKCGQNKCDIIIICNLNFNFQKGRIATDYALEHVGSVTHKALQGEVRDFDLTIYLAETSFDNTLRNAIKVIITNFGLSIFY